ncbi:YtzI protein [Mesobacillus harenae]|uniref:YtzI protein n=1 Tax=Mesobacillus harenae TaxID=2213203 RepID=UPI00158065DD|nr:YtzI protein [Mesobacillus harenae]
MYTVLVISVVIVIVVLLLAVITTSKAYSFKHTVDPVQEHLFEDKDQEETVKKLDEK